MTRPASLLLLACVSAGCTSTTAAGPPDADPSEDGGADVGEDHGPPDDGGSGGDADAGLPSGIHVAPGGRYFRTEAGEPFIVVGNQPGMGFLDPQGRDLAAWEAEVEEHLARMESYGETVLRVDFDYAYGWEDLGDGIPSEYVGLENPIGRFVPERVEAIDVLFRLAEEHGIRVLVVPWITSPPMWPTWELNPYFRAEGDPDDPYRDFLVPAEARSAFAGRLEWIAERWSGGPAFFGWDLMNEADVLLGWVDAGTCDPAIDDAPALESWVLEIGSRVAEVESTAYGHARPRMVSWSCSEPTDPLEFLFDSTALDVAAVHPYDLYGDVNMTSVVGPAVAMHARVTTAVETRIADRRPFLENERDDNANYIPRFQREGDHDMAWAELASGAAGAGITWMPAGGEELRRHHENFGPDRRALRDFVQRVPGEFFLAPAADEAFDSALTVTGPAAGEVEAMSVRRDGRAIGWLLGLDERCALAACVQDVRAEFAAAGRSAYLNQAIALWYDLLAGEGLADPELEDLYVALQRALREGTPAEVDAATRALLARMERLEVETGMLGGLVDCPDLAPEIEFLLPPGDYVVEWVDDTTGEAVRADRLAGGSGTLVPPAFELHLAVVVRPE